MASAIPNPRADRHDVPCLFGGFVSGAAAVIDDVVASGEHPVRQPVVTHELPNVLLWLGLGTFGYQRRDHDVVRHGR